MPASRRHRPRRRTLAIGALLLYLAALAVIGLWPTPVDRGADAAVADVLGAVPLLTYDGLEWGANVLLFVPLGLLGALMVHRPSTALAVIPFAGLVTSSMIETVQSDMIPGRIGSVLDVIANTLGASIGCLVGVGLALLEERRRARRRELRSGPAHADVPPAGGAPGRRIEAVAPVDHDLIGHEPRGVLG